MTHVKYDNFRVVEYSFMNRGNYNGGKQIHDTVFTLSLLTVEETGCLTNRVSWVVIPKVL